VQGRSLMPTHPLTFTAFSMRSLALRMLSTNDSVSAGTMRKKLRRWLSESAPLPLPFLSPSPPPAPPSPPSPPAPAPPAGFCLTRDSWNTDTSSWKKSVDSLKRSVRLRSTASSCRAASSVSADRPGALASGAAALTPAPSPSPSAADRTNLTPAASSSKWGMSVRSGTHLTASDAACMPAVRTMRTYPSALPISLISCLNLSRYDKRSSTTPSLRISRVRLSARSCGYLFSSATRSLRKNRRSYATRTRGCARLVGEGGRGSMVALHRHLPLPIPLLTFIR